MALGRRQRGLGIVAALCAVIALAAAALVAFDPNTEITDSSATAEADTVVRGTLNADALARALVAQDLAAPPVAACTAQSLIKDLDQLQVKAIISGLPEGSQGLRGRIGAAVLVCSTS
ncbi:MAG TPA: hypothetical protein VK326_07545 [Solirubrobacterales bacterium]|nr:hypothetical protein [Solirubrobacterales bacterium]